MEMVHILLIDTSATFKKLLEATSIGSESVHFDVAVLEPHGDVATIGEASRKADVIVFGEKLSSSTVVQFSRSVRELGVRVPILVLTKQSEAGVPRNYQRAGVDDMFNVADMKTPLFSWTFMSTLRNAETKKKAKEFDTLQDRLKSANQTLAFITHEINNPLSVIRLALYHLQVDDASKGRREALFQMLSENVDKVNRQLDQLRSVRRLLGNGCSGPAPESTPVPQKQQVA
jgi:signal transduction histidine kinase